MDFAAVKSRLAGSEGRLYWRSLGELSDSEQFREYLHREFPEQASQWNDPKGRRQFLKLMSASLALAGISACTKQPAEKIVPYVKQPEDLVPGRPLFFATAVPFAGIAAPVLVESHEGHPTKVEGNPQHPASVGATDIFTQAAILTPLRPGSVADGPVSHRGPRLGRLPVGREGRPRGPEGEAGVGPPVPDGNDHVAVGRRADRAHPAGLPEGEVAPVGSGPARCRPRRRGAGRRPPRRGHLPLRQGRRHRHARLGLPGVAVPRASATRTTSRSAAAPASTSSMAPRAAAATMNRLYAIESTPTLTGAKADNRLALKASEIEAAARALSERGRAGSGSFSNPGAAKFLAAVAKDLQAHRGSSVVVAGEYQPAPVHHLAHQMNQALGNVGTTVTYAPTVEVDADGSDRVAARSRHGDGRGPGRDARHPRLEPGLHGAGGLQVPGAAGQGPARRSRTRSTPTRRRSCAIGTSPRRMPSRAGATRAPTTAPSPSCSR